MTYRILLSGGGTAGSVTPLLALAEQIRRQHSDVEFLFLGSATGPERVLAEAASIPFEPIASGKFRRYWSWANVTDMQSIVRGYSQSRKIIRRWQPHIAITAGSFVSVPVIWAAHRLQVPTLVHQQDVRPGLANRLMAPAASLVTVAFRESARAFPEAKVRWIGNPVRADVLAGDAERARELFKVPPGVPTLLVLGGGTGSAALNGLIGTMAHRLVRQWFIIHVTGAERDFMELHDPHYCRFPFLTWQLPHAMALADVVVTRAGLGTMSELAALGKSTIIIPMPDSHQEDNARVVAEASAGIVLDQRVSIQSRLEEALERLRQNPKERLRLGMNMKQFYNAQALPQFVDAALHLMRV